jgi:dTDP-4-amino-4,6-dideoxygalactose transaminase
MKRHIPIARPITANEKLKAIEEVLKSGMLAHGRWQVNLKICFLNPSPP